MNEKSVEVILADHEKKILELQEALTLHPNDVAKKVMAAIRENDEADVVRRVIKELSNMELYHHMGDWKGSYKGTGIKNDNKKTN
jgi:hypothetical protein